jgi:putative MATE family efflux protein
LFYYHFNNLVITTIMQDQHSPTLQPNLSPTPWEIIKQSLRGEERDYTQGSIRQAMFLLAIPMMLELCLESVFAVVDMFFVGKLGANAIATVGLTESVMFLVYSLAMGISIAATAIVARRVGEKSPEDAARAGAQAVMLSVAAAAVCSVVGAVFASEILTLMGASAAVVAEGTPFVRTMFGGSVVVVLIFVINGVFRGAGDAAMAMQSLWFASLLNIALCPVFIHFFGLVGAAWATVLARGAGVGYQLLRLRSGRGALRFGWQHFRPDASVIRSLITVALPAAFQNIIASGSWVVLVRLVAETSGTAASAGYQIAIRNMMFFLMPAWGLSNAAATLVGQNLGAKQPERAEESVMLAAKYNIVFLSVVTALFVLVAVPIVSVFTHDAAVLRYGTLALQIIGSGFIFYGLGMVMMAALNGAGDTRTPTIINVVGFWCFQIPLAFFLAKGLDWRATGGLIAIPAAETLIALLAFYFFKRGAWKEVKV